MSMYLCSVGQNYTHLDLDKGHGEDTLYGT